MFAIVICDWDDNPDRVVTGFATVKEAEEWILDRIDASHPRYVVPLTSREEDEANEREWEAAEAVGIDGEERWQLDSYWAEQLDPKEKS
jgi:hypothetical protein